LYERICEFEDEELLTATIARQITDEVKGNKLDDVYLKSNFF